MPRQIRIEYPGAMRSRKGDDREATARRNDSIFEDSRQALEYGKVEERVEAARTNPMILRTDPFLSLRAIAEM